MPAADRAKLLFKLWALKDNPRPVGCEKITGTDYWRLRQRDWRAIYAIFDEKRLVLVAIVARRNERTYDGLS